MENECRRRTAFHEAGHAVIGRVLGMTCGHATIVSDDDSSGHAITDDPLYIVGHWYDRGKYRGDELRSIFRGRIITYMAGAEAEREILGECTVGDGDDRYWIEDMAACGDAELPDDLWVRYEPRMRRQARRLIRKHRKKIERVALSLMEKETLTADEIDALMS